MEIWTNVETVMKGALKAAKLKPGDLAAVGVTNQRETTLLWDKATGEPIHNAIVWQDTRTDKLVKKLGRARRARTGFARSAACRSPPISPARRSAGCWTR